ncbi:MAG: tyrosine-type recombinase/integrase [Yoonia sp.]
MPKRALELKSIQVNRIATPGRHPVGGVSGLHLNVTDTGAKSWILRVMVGNKRRHIGLGSLADVSLAQARDLAREKRKMIAEGIDPVEVRKETRALALLQSEKGITFEDAFERYFAEKLESELSNPKHRAQWRSTLTTYAYPTIGNLAVNEVSKEAVLSVLAPIWVTKTETATRVRQRIERVLDWATAMGYRSGPNPALWKGNLQQLLPAPAKIKNVVHYPAIALDDVTRWFKILRTRDGVAAKAVEFLTLTASRSQEIRKARWDEISFETGVWNVPADHMKAKIAHRVLLSKAALELLQKTPRFEGCSLVFPSPRNGEMSDATLAAVLKRIQKAEMSDGGLGFVDPVSRRPAVPHGLRSTFRDWAAEKTEHASDLAEIALAHEVGNEVQRAYRRGDMLERRRQLMEDWAVFLEAQ